MDYDKTAFNSGMASLERLDYLLKKCNNYSCLAMLPNEDTGTKVNPLALQVWQTNIYSLYREISPKLKNEEVEQMKTLFDKLENSFNLYNKHRTEEGFITSINIKEFKRKWFLLADAEQTLRKFADERDMLLPDKTEFDMSMI